MKFEDIKTELENGVLVIEIARYEVKNALRTNTLKEICQALEQNLNDTKCVIITGCEDFFAAGADINELEQKGTIEAINDVRTSYWEAIKNYKLPIIAAVNGYCLGGGCELAMLCDIIIAGDNAVFGQPEINLGVMPGAGGTQRSIKAMGKSNAMLLLLSGELILAKRALQMNLISEILPTQSTMYRARQIAKGISQKAPLAIQAIKSAALESFNAHLDASLKYEKILFSGILSTEDKKEGISAFKEKRKAKFKGL